MQTLKDIFPKPNLPSQRNFIVENKRKLKDLQKKNKCGSSQPTTNKNVNILKTSNTNRHKRHLDGLKKSGLSVNAKSIKQNGTTVVNGKEKNEKKFDGDQLTSVSSSSKNLPRDASSQTTNLDDSLFLKDVIIRIPSASILNDLKEKSKQNNAVPSISEQSIEQKQDDGGGDDVRNNLNGSKQKPISINKGGLTKLSGAVGEYNARRANQIDKLNDFYAKSYVDKPKPLSDQHVEECHNMVRECLGRKSQLKAHLMQDSVAALMNSTLSLPNTKKSIVNIVGNMDAVEPKLSATKTFSELPNSFRQNCLQENLLKSDLENFSNINCPPGCLVLSEEERIESLAFAKKKYDEVILELNRLPMTDSLRIIQAKKEKNQQLDKLEENIKIFSRPKVYVKIEP